MGPPAESPSAAMRASTCARKSDTLLYCPLAPRARSAPRAPPRRRAQWGGAGRDWELVARGVPAVAVADQLLRRKHHLEGFWGG